MFKAIKRSVITAVALLPLLVAGLHATSVSAAVKYDPNGTPTSTTPVFNQFYDVPYGVGNEADFVRLKPQAGGNADYVDPLNSACDTNSAYTVRTYVHNGADPAYNNNGSGSAVAHNTVVRMTAPLGSTSNNFVFNSTVSASNAAAVSDSGRLICGQTVKLSLVPGSVKVTTLAGGTKSAPDSAVNGVLPIDSRGVAGDVWACWDDRVIVTYDVKVVKETPPPVSSGDCKVTDVTIDKTNRSVQAKVIGVTENATIVGYKIDFGDGTVVNQQSASHTYAKDGTYVITGSVQVKYADGHTEWKTVDNCKKQVTFKGGVPVTPVTPVTPPTGILPDTGAGSVAALFTATSIGAAMAYRVFIKRRLTADL